MEVFLDVVDTLEDWLESVDTDPDGTAILHSGIPERTSRAVTMMDIARGNFSDMTKGTEVKGPSEWGGAWGRLANPRTA